MALENQPLFQAPSIPKMGKRTVSSSVFSNVAKVKSGLSLNKSKFSFVRPLQKQKVVQPDQLKAQVSGVETTNVAATLVETNRILVEIQKQLALDFANRITEKKQLLELSRRTTLKQKAVKKENFVEKGKQTAKGVLAPFEKVIAPAKGIFDKILDFLALVGTGIVLNTAWEWLSDEENRQKLKDVFEFLGKNWKIIAGIIVGGFIAKKLRQLYKVINALRKILKFLRGPKVKPTKPLQKPVTPDNICDLVLDCLKGGGSVTYNYIRDRLLKDGKFRDGFGGVGTPILPPPPPINDPDEKPVEKPVEEPQYLPIGVEFDPTRPDLPMHPKTRMTGTDIFGDLATLLASAAIVYGGMYALSGSIGTQGILPQLSKLKNLAPKFLKKPPVVPQAAPSAARVTTQSSAFRGISDAQRIQNAEMIRAASSRGPLGGYGSASRGPVANVARQPQVQPRPTPTPQPSPRIDSSRIRITEPKFRNPIRKRVTGQSNREVEFPPNIQSNPTIERLSRMRSEALKRGDVEGFRRALEEETLMRSLLKTGLSRGGFTGLIPGISSMVDTIPAMLAKGEFVINSMSTKLFKPFLYAINANAGELFNDFIEFTTKFVENVNKKFDLVNDEFDQNKELAKLIYELKEREREKKLKEDDPKDDPKGGGIGPQSSIKPTPKTTSKTIQTYNVRKKTSSSNGQPTIVNMPMPAVNLAGNQTPEAPNTNVHEPSTAPISISSFDSSNPYIAESLADYGIFV